MAPASGRLPIPPSLLESLPCDFGAGAASELGRAVAQLRAVNARNGCRLGADVPIGFLTPRWRRHIVGEGNGGDSPSRSHYELAVLTTLNERIKSGDVSSGF